MFPNADFAAHAVEPDALMPVSLATRAVHSALYPCAAIESSKLLGIAHVMAALIPMYAYDPHNSRKLQRLAPRDLLSGCFRYSSCELHFKDRHAAVVDVAVKNAGVAEVIALLRDAAGAGYVARSIPA